MSKKVNRLKLKLTQAKKYIECDKIRLQKLLKAARKESETDQFGELVIRIGKKLGSGRDLIGVQMTINPHELLYGMMKADSNISGQVRVWSYQICRELEAGILKYMEENRVR